MITLGFRLKKTWKIAVLVAAVASSCALPIYAAVRLVSEIVSLVPPVPAGTGEWTALVKIAVGGICVFVGTGPTLILVALLAAVAIVVVEALVGRDF